MSIEEEEGKREEDTGAVQGTQGPSAYLSNHLFYLLFVSYFLLISYMTLSSYIVVNFWLYRVIFK